MEFDPERGTHGTNHEVGGENSLSTTVPVTLSDSTDRIKTGVDVLLSDAVDPDTLDAPVTAAGVIETRPPEPEVDLQ